MTANSWRFTVTGTLERSTVWRAAERSWIAERGLRRGSAVGVTMPVSWRCFLIFALIGGAAGCLASCAGGQPAPPATTASVAARQPSPPKAALPPDMPRPMRKPAPPPGPESVMSRPGAETMAMIGPEAPASGPAAAAAPSPQVQDLLGLDQPTATRLLGAAVERSEEPPATIWRYKTANCE